MTAALKHLDRWWLAPAPPERLAILRILVGGFGLIYLLVRAQHLVSYANFRDDQFSPAGVANLIDEPLPGLAVRLLVVASIVAGAAFVAGWRFRISGPAFALLLLWVLTYRNSFAQVFHTENLLVLHVIILAIAPAADALSLDARRRLSPATATPDHGWPVRLMAVVTVLAYVIAGVTKLQNAGIEWATGDVLRNYVAYDNLRKAELGDTHSPIGAWMIQFGWPFKPLAFLTLAAELLAPLALFGRWFRNTWVLLVWGFHVGVLATMAILFPYQLLGLAFAPFFPLEKIPYRRWLRLETPAPSVIGEPAG